MSRDDRGEDGRPASQDRHRGGKRGDWTVTFTIAARNPVRLRTHGVAA
jgi:hypothetical protein